MSFRTWKKIGRLSLLAQPAIYENIDRDKNSNQKKKFPFANVPNRLGKTQSGSTFLPLNQNGEYNGHSTEQNYNKKFLQIARCIPVVNASTTETPEYRKITTTEEKTSEHNKKCMSKLVVALAIRKHYMFYSFQEFSKPTADLLRGVHRDNFKDYKELTATLEFDEYEKRHDSSIKRKNGSKVFSSREKDNVEDLEFRTEMKKGIVHVYDQKHALQLNYEDYKSFVAHHSAIIDAIMDGPLKTFCLRRLEYLSTKFNLHTHLNEHHELEEKKRIPQTKDLYSVEKVDTHVHAGRCMTKQHLLTFIREKLKSEGDRIVHEDKQNNCKKTLKEIVKELGLEHNINAHTLGVNADRETFHRFDLFNKKSPFGEPLFKDIFTKIDNVIEGQYFALILKGVVKDLEHRNEKAEIRITIQGKSADEWDKLAEWAEKYHETMYSEHVRWVVQIPRRYNNLRKEVKDKVVMREKLCSFINCLRKENKDKVGMREELCSCINRLQKEDKDKVDTFQKFLQNIFEPLMKVTINPAANPKLYKFLKHVVAIDSVDDESCKEHSFDAENTKTPDKWTSADNPPYAYYLFYMHANIAVLNRLRRFRNYNTFSFHPHCGEEGKFTHLVAGFMFGYNICHGIKLKEIPVMQYLYYLSQTGIAMSPISNNALFLPYRESPLPDFFKRGLNVSLSTDDPLIFHYTQNPLLEEYAVAAHVWKFSLTDLYEIARNSVLQSGFEPKAKLLSPSHSQDEYKTQIRQLYRKDNLKEEFDCIRQNDKFHNIMIKDLLYVFNANDVIVYKRYQDLHNSKLHI